MAAKSSDGSTALDQLSAFLSQSGITLPAGGVTTSGANALFDTLDSSMPVSQPGPVEGPAVGGAGGGGIEVPTVPGGPVVTVGDEIKNFYRMDPAQRAALKQQLYAGGFYGGSTYVAGGSPDAAADQAYRHALEMGARLFAAGKPPVSITQVIADAASQQSKTAINSNDIAATAQAVAQKTLGRNLSAKELARFSEEFAAQAYGASGPQTSAGLEYLGQQVLTKENPKEAAATSLHAISQRALQVLSQPAVSLPSPQ